MPTVSNRDFNGYWSERKSSVGGDALTVKRFKEGHGLNMLPSTRTSVAESIAEEHGYAVTQRFVSSNSYYGYHPVMTAGDVGDCSMDISEHTAIAGFNPDNTCGPAEWLVSRKRCLEGGMDLDCDGNMTVTKRVRYNPVPETPPSCHPLSTQRPYREPPMEQQLPGNTSYLKEAVMPQPRCLMGHYV